MWRKQVSSLLSEWSFTICLTSYNHKQNVLTAVLNKTFPSFLKVPTGYPAPRVLVTIPVVLSVSTSPVLAVPGVLSVSTSSVLAVPVVLSVSTSPVVSSSSGIVCLHIPCVNSSRGIVCLHIPCVSSTSVYCLSPQPLCY